MTKQELIDLPLGTILNEKTFYYIKKIGFYSIYVERDDCEYEFYGEYFECLGSTYFYKCKGGIYGLELCKQKEINIFNGDINQIKMNE